MAARNLIVQPVADRPDDASGKVFIAAVGHRHRPSKHQVEVAVAAIVFRHGADIAALGRTALSPHRPTRFDEYFVGPLLVPQVMILEAPIVSARLPGHSCPYCSTPILRGVEIAH